MKRGYVYVWGTSKNVWVLRVCFLKSKSIKAKNVEKMSQNRLFTTTLKTDFQLLPVFPL